MVAGRIIDFYELDPKMIHVATTFFSFTKDSLAQINYIIGDARLSLQKAHDVKYDVLVVDAFSGDSVPGHLLTKEMMDVYREHLTDRGILLIHATNRYVDLDSIAMQTATAAHAKICSKSSGTLEVWESPSFWIAITWDRGVYDKLIGDLKWDAEELRVGNRVWTDEYSSVISYIKQDFLFDSIKNFAPFYW
jgi:spermidine synthase